MLIHHTGPVMGASLSNVDSIRFEDTDEGVVMWCLDKAGNYVKVLLPKQQRQLKVVS